MDHTYWHKQLAGKPLFPDLEWSRPETKASAGKLLIVGGNVHGFSAPAEAYQTAQSTGIGSMRVVLPASLQKTVGTFLENAFFVPSTRSGSLAKDALAEIIEHAHWADGMLLTGELGRNSETAVLLESLLQKTTVSAVLTQDAIDYFYAQPRTLLDRDQTVIVGSLSQLQQLAVKAKYPQPLRFQMDLLQLVAWLHDFTTTFVCSVMVQHLGYLFVAHGGKVSTTPHTEEIWRLSTAARASVWLIQHPSKPFEALTTALV